MLRFYKAHRALVRAKVDCLSRTSFAEGVTQQGFAVEAADYLNLATSAATTVRPALVAMSGLSGTGKSTVAAALGRTLGTPVFASDVVRKELTRHAGPAPASWEQGLYTPEQTEATYEHLYELGAQSLATGRAAILDATFLDERRREQLAATARNLGAPLVLVETTCDEEIATGRILARAGRGDARSDATVEIYRRQRAEHQATPPTVPREALHIVVDTDVDGTVILEPALAALKRADIIAARIPGT